MQADFIFNISIWHYIFCVPVSCTKVYKQTRCLSLKTLWSDIFYFKFSVFYLPSLTRTTRMKVGDLNLKKTWTPTHTMCLSFIIYFLCITLVHVYIVAFSNKNFNLSLFMKFPYALELSINSLLWKESLNSDGQLHNSININKTYNHLSP